MSPEDFPITPKIKNTEGYIEIKSVFLKEAIQQVTVASQYSDLRPELNSVLFNFSLESLVLASTDGFRLAERSIPSNLFVVKKKEPFKMLIPLRTSLEVARIMRDDEVVRIYQDENQVLFKTDQTEMISRLVEGAFPDYSAIVPHEFAAEIVVNRDEFLNAIKLAGVFGQKNSEVKIKIHQNKKAIEISSADQALGENNNILPAKIQGDIPEVFFNWRYLSDPMKGIKAEEVFLGLQEDAGPALIRSVSDQSYFYVLKPILKS
jgi:DNA polymerase-3 subunit beta